MSYCENCQHCDVINRYCFRLGKALSRCAGGCSFNRKTDKAIKTDEQIRQEQEARKTALSPFLDKIICGDSIEMMKKLPDN